MDSPGTAPAAGEGDSPAVANLHEAAAGRKQSRRARHNKQALIPKVREPDREPDHGTGGRGGTNA
jgi:hypothetical protein